MPHQSAPFDHFDPDRRALTSEKDEKPGSWLTTARTATLASCLVLMTTGLQTGRPAHAGDGWNPFVQRHEYRPPHRAPATVPIQDRNGRYDRSDHPYDRDSRWPAEPRDGGITPDAPAGYGQNRRPAVHPSPPSPGYGLAPPPVDETTGGDGRSTDGGPLGRNPGDQSGNRTEPGIGRVEQGDLAPLRSGTDGGLPSGAWQGLDLATTEQLVSPLKLPNRSQQLTALWLKALDTSPTDRDDGQFAALTADAFYRSGRLARAADRIQTAAAQSKKPVVQALLARILLGTEDTARACPAAKQAAVDSKKLPRALRGEMFAIVGYCAIRAGKTEAGSLAADLARQEGYRNRFTLSLLESIGKRRKPDKLSASDRADLLDGLLLQHAGVSSAPAMMAHATSPLLSFYARSDAVDTTTRVAAAEEAAGRNIIGMRALAAAYRAHRFSTEAYANALGPRVDPALRRALLFQTAERDRTPFSRTRLIRALIDDAKRHDLGLEMLQLTKPLIDDLPRKPEIGWFAETAIEATLAAGDYESARAWTIFSAALDRNAGGTLEHWQALIDIAESKPGQPANADFQAIEGLAARGRFSALTLHRLATVLDALDYNVPIPLWEAASATPQPKSGHLPPTGVLTQLQDAARNKQFARVILLSLRTIGPEGTTGANILALGETVRALKRAGLEPEARRLAFEALFEDWPRMQAR